MAKPKKLNNSFKNYIAYSNYRKGKGKPTKLENAVLQHPDESENSIYNYMQKKKQRNLWVVNFEQFKKMGMNESRDKWNFDWDAILRSGEDSNRIEDDTNKREELTDKMMALAEEYENDFGIDSYAVFDVMYEILENIPRAEIEKEY